MRTREQGGGPTSLAAATGREVGLLTETGRAAEELV